MRSIELRRHASREPDEDRLSAEGRAEAERVGRDLPGGYLALYTSPADRAAETAAWFLRGLGQRLPQQHGVAEGLGTAVEDRWRSAARTAGSGRIDLVRTEDPDLVDEESARLAAAVRQLLHQIPDGARALAVGHSPLIEAAVFGLTGETVEPLRECEGVLLQEEDGEVRLAEVYRRE